MKIYRRHEWTLSSAAAIALQKQMATEVVHNRPLNVDAVRLVAGVDVSVKDNLAQAAVVVVKIPGFEIVETARAQRPTTFPYIPGLLSFREGPVLEDAFTKLQTEPDVFIFDGMGRAHPRRLGIASQMGLWLQKPTIGCGKTLFVGQYVEPPNERGAWVELIDRGEVIGAIVRTRPRVKPVYISVGHLADLSTSVKLVMRCVLKYRLPEPIRFAHNAAGAF